MIFNAEVAQRQSNGFVNRRLEVQILSSALCLGRWQSGQLHETVNLAALGLHRFESYPAHQINIKRNVFTKLTKSYIIKIENIEII